MDAGGGVGWSAVYQGGATFGLNGVQAVWLCFRVLF